MPVIVLNSMNHQTLNRIDDTEISKMEKIYILKNNRLFIGPYSVEKIRQKSLKPDDLVWYEGLPDWTEAHQTDLLRDAIDYSSTIEQPPSFKTRFLKFFHKLVR